MNVLITAGLGGVILAAIGYTLLALEKRANRAPDMGHVALPRKRA